MPIFTDGPRLQPERGLDINEFPAGLGEYLGASAAEAAHDWPTSRLADLGELSAKPRLDDGQPPTVDVPLANARQQVKDAGLDKTLTLPAQETIRQAALDIMLRRERDRREREATIARGPDGVMSSALAVGTSFLVAAVDPLNLGASFIPVVGELRYAKLLADAGGSAMGRAGARAAVGAAEGAVGQAVLEPIQAAATAQEGRDYSAAHFLRSVIFGAGLGAGLRAGGGVIADVVRGMHGDELFPFREGEPFARQDSSGFPTTAAELKQITELGGAEAPTEPMSIFSPSNEGAKSVVAFADRLRERLGLTERTPTPAMEVIADLPPRAKEDAMRAATAALVSGEPVRVGEMVEAAAKVDPRIAESAAKGEPDEADIVTKHMGPKKPRGARARDPDTWSLLEFIASRGGIDPTDPLIGDVHGLTGGVRKFVPGFGDLVRKGGLRLDAMREAAVEAGYIHDLGFTDRNAQSTSTISTLLEAMDKEMRGQRVYKYDRQPEPTKAERAEQRAVEQDQYEHHVHNTLVDEGIDGANIPDKTFARVVEIMQREGESDALSAYERAVMEEIYYGAEAGQHGRIPDAIQGWDRVPDDAGAAPASGGLGASGGERDAGGSGRAGGGGDRAALERDAWRELSRPVAEDGEALAASRAADKLPEPPSTAPDKRLEAAEKSAADAEQAYLSAEPYLPPDLRQRVADELVQFDENLAAQTEVIRRGGACLAAAG